MSGTPEWITGGTEVMVATDGAPGTYRGLHKTRIVKVNSQTFLVDEEDHRFSKDTQDVRLSGYSRRKVVPYDSERGRVWHAEMRRSNLVTTLRKAYEAWDKNNGDRDLQNALDKAVSKLRTFDDALTPWLLKEITPSPRRP